MKCTPYHAKVKAKETFRADVMTMFQCYWWCKSALLHFRSDHTHTFYYAIPTDLPFTYLPRVITVFKVSWKKIWKHNITFCWKPTAIWGALQFKIILYVEMLPSFICFQWFVQWIVLSTLRTTGARWLAKSPAKEKKKVTWPGPPNCTLRAPTISIILRFIRIYDLLYWSIS